MDSSYDIVIVGGGLAGAFSAFSLSKTGWVALLEKEHPAAGASGAGAGLVNPFMARKANPVWRWEECLDSLENSLAQAGYSELFRKSGVLRPAADARQSEWFKETARLHPDDCSWMEEADISERWPSIAAPEGGLMIRSGGSLDLVSLVDALLNAADKRGCEIHHHTNVMGIREDASGVILQTNLGDLKARRVVLCVGADYYQWKDLLAGLPLHQLKGQTVVVERPSGLGSGLPCISGNGYIIPYPDQLVLGSTYHHDFSHRDASTTDTIEILTKTRRVMPKLEGARVLSLAAGVRVTVPKTRLPLLGPVTKSGRIWIFSGLGSKGILMGALLGRHLPSFLADPETIPGELTAGLPDLS